MDTQQHASITVRGTKALIKWMRWEHENNEPSPSQEELLRIMAGILVDTEIDIRRRPGPGRPPKSDTPRPAYLTSCTTISPKDVEV